LRGDGINYTLVGLAVVAAAGLLLLALVLIGGRSIASSDYVVHYRNVTGLRIGAPVFYQGYRVGAVANLVPERNEAGTRYRVTLAVRRDWPIPVDSRAQLQSSGLLADVAVGIREGSSREVLQPGGELAGDEGGNVFVAMNELVTELAELTRSQVAPLVGVLSRRADSLGDMLDANAPAILAETRGLLARMNQAADALEDVMKPDNRAAVAATLADAQRLAAELRQTRAGIDRAVEGMAGVAEDNREDIRHAVRDLSSVLQTLSSRVDVITHHLESASRNLNQFSREIRRQPNRLIIAPRADKLEESP
jgi:phospholipid/cholesterol/gamma-HCH transport system substrate-binding protein